MSKVYGGKNGNSRHVLVGVSVLVSSSSVDCVLMTFHVSNEYCDLIGSVRTEEFDGTIFLFLYT